MAAQRVNSSHADIKKVHKIIQVLSSGTQPQSQPSTRSLSATSTRIGLAHNTTTREPIQNFNSGGQFEIITPGSHFLQIVNLNNVEMS